MFPIIIVNNHKQSALPVMDRGLAYGDGLFETMLYTHGKIPLWEYHYQRLKNGLLKLQISLDDDRLFDQRDRVLDELSGFEGDYVIKLIVTRGVGSRGYVPSNDALSTLITISNPFVHDTDCPKGVVTHICDQRLPDDCAWAGLKTLNQLSYVLASQERMGKDYEEGIMLTVSGRLIEATARNIFLVIDEQIYTPDLAQVGVAGVMREFLLDASSQASGIDIYQKTLTLDHLSMAQEVFLTNSITGVWSVIQCDTHIWPVGPIATSIHKNFQAFLKQ